MDFLSQLDSSLLLAINGWHSAWADQFMYAYSSKWVWIPMYVSLVYFIFRNLHWRTALGCAVAVALTIVFADQVCSHLIRPAAERLRPSCLDNPISEYVHIVNGYRSGRYGFPSAHAANTFGLACLLTWVFRNRALSTFMVLWALVTCYSRAYLGVHYPGDLVVGAFVGCVGATLCYWLFVWLFRVTPPPHTHGSSFTRKRLRHVWIPIGVGVATMIVMALPVW